MIKPRLFTTSLDAYPQDIHQFLLRGYKYLRTMSQFHEDDDMDNIIVSRFIKKTKTAKTLKKLVLKINPSCSNVQMTTEQVRSILKAHSQNLKGLDVCELPCLQGKIPKGFLLPVKNIKVVHMKARKAEIKGLQGFRDLERAWIDMRYPNMKMNLLYMALAKLKNMKKIELLPYPVDLSRTLELLDQLTAKFGKQLNIHIAASKGNENYNKLPEINDSLSKMITQLKLESIATISLLDDLFRNSAPVFTNMHKLELKFNVPDLDLVSYLKLLSTMPVLGKLSLEFGDLCSKEFSQALMNNMSLPLSIQQLKIKIPLSLESYLINNLELIQNSRKRFPWRQKNYFEEEPCLKSFFKAFENTKSLRKLSLDFKMLENFSSYSTSFFIAILNRLQGLNSFEISVKEFSKQENPGQEPECFDVALLLDCCSKMTQLQSIEVAMPNLLFEDAKLSQNLTSLKEFHIGISEHEDNETLKFGVAKTMKGILNCLVNIAPNLKSLILDFREVIDGPTFCSRFMLIERFKNLEYLHLRMVIEKCNSQKIKTVGKLLQSLKKLKTLVLHFNDSDPKIFSIRTYISYHRHIREVLLVSNDAVWLGNAYMYPADRDMIE